jgi:hypothetical protein
LYSNCKNQTRDDVIKEHLTCTEPMVKWIVRIATEMIFAVSRVFCGELHEALGN